MADLSRATKFDVCVRHKIFAEFVGKNFLVVFRTVVVLVVVLVVFVLVVVFLHFVVLSRVDFLGESTDALEIDVTKEEKQRWIMLGAC